MIIVSRLNGHEFALNCNLIEKVEANLDTVITLIDGTKFVISESVDRVIELVRTYQASIMSTTDEFAGRTPNRAHLHLVGPAQES
jgi:flagellar protein FlbD